MEQRRKNIFIRTVLITGTLLFYGCIPFKPSLDSERVDEIAGKLILLSSKAESLVRYSNKEYTRTALSSEIANKNLSLMAYFDKLHLDYNIKGKHVSVLVCDKEKTFMIAEDSNCTAKIDRKASTEKLPCTFMIDMDTICVYQ